MPEVGFLKIFSHKPPFENPETLGRMESLKILKAAYFPLAVSLFVVALVKLEPKSLGTFSLRMPDTSHDYYNSTHENTHGEPIWAVVAQEDLQFTVNMPCVVQAVVEMNGIVLHKAALEIC